MKKLIDGITDTRSLSRKVRHLDFLAWREDRHIDNCYLRDTFAAILSQFETSRTHCLGRSDNL